MDCEHAQSALIDLHEDTLAPAQRAEIEQHVADCNDCRTDLANVRMFSTASDQWEEQTPPLWNPKRLLPAPERTWSRSVREWLPVAATLLLGAIVVGGELGEQPVTPAGGAEIASVQNTPSVVAGAPDQTVTVSELRQVVAELRAENAHNREVIARSVLAVTSSQRRQDLDTMLRLVSNSSVQIPQRSPEEIQRLLEWPGEDRSTSNNFGDLIHTVGDRR